MAVPHGFTPGSGTGSLASLEGFLAGFDVLERAAAIDVDERVATRVAAEVSALEHPGAVGISVLRDLLRIEDNPERFRRLLRAWSAKVSDAVRGGDLEAADAWLRAVLVGPVHPADFAEDVGAAFTGLCRVELLESVATRVAAADATPAGAERLVAALGEPMVRYLVDQMALDDPIVNRRHIVQCLGWAGATDLRLLIAHVNDPRWFIQRNIATALGRTGRAQAVAPLQVLLDHEDDRVRVEALRARAQLDRDGSVSVIVRSLSDDSRRVRAAAVSLLRASPSPEVVGEVLRVVEQRLVSADEARRLVEAVAGRRDPAVEPALRRLARRRAPIGSARAARDAARDALARRPS